MPRRAASPAAAVATAAEVAADGFKQSGMPKVEVHRKERSTTLLCRGENHDPTLVAVASDEPLDLDVPVLDLNDVAQICPGRRSPSCFLNNVTI